MNDGSRGVPDAETASTQKKRNSPSRPAPTALQALTPEGTPSEGRVAAMVTLAVVGMIGCIAWMATVTPPASLRVDVEAMQDTSQWVTWMLILAIQTAVWFALLIPTFQATRAAEPDRSRSVLLHIAVVIILLVAPLLTSNLEVFAMSHRVQEAFGLRLRILTLIAGLPVLIAVIGIVRTGKQIQDFDAAAAASKPADAITSYLELRRRLLFLGGVLALIVALAVLGTGGFRNTIVAMETARAEAATAAAEAAAAEAGAEADAAEAGTVATESGETAEPESVQLMRAAAAAKQRATRFGVELVWSYGLFYSFILVPIYLPAYLSLVGAGREIRDAIRPPLIPGDAKYEENKKLRDELDAVLQLKLGASETLKAAALILVPLATSLASTLLGGVEVGG